MKFKLFVGLSTRSPVHSPQPLRLAPIAKAHFEDVRLPVIPAWIQRNALAMGAPMGRLLGFGATYEPVAALPPVYA
jgi:hypothetical protein